MRFGFGLSCVPIAAPQISSPNDKPDERIIGRGVRILVLVGVRGGRLLNRRPMRRAGRSWKNAIG